MDIAVAMAQRVMRFGVLVIYRAAKSFQLRIAATTLLVAHLRKGRKPLDISDVQGSGPIEVCVVRFPRVLGIACKEDDLIVIYVLGYEPKYLEVVDSLGECRGSQPGRCAQFGQAHGATVQEKKVELTGGRRYTQRAKKRSRIRS